LNARTDIVIGVEIDPENIRAIAYDAAHIARGKARRSTKLARGTDAVLARMARCIADAADEGDLSMALIGSVGVAVPGQVEQAADRTVTAESLNWNAVPLEQLLGAHLHLPVRAANRIELSARAVWLRDLCRRPGVLAMLFLDSTLDGALLHDSRVLPAEEAPSFHQLIADAKSAWERRIPDPWRNRATRDWRKALKRGEPAVCGFVGDSMSELGRLIVRLAEEARPEVIVIGGGMMEDRRAALTEKILAHVRSLGSSVANLDRRITYSELGENAVLIGAAALARDERTRGHACAAAVAP
jgi:glucokinase